ncbi:septal ring lytic transglycosylase RlpA family protein [Rhizobium hidalgonense]|uniref:Septal ring lytic transglycosylase RlpA family protein n=1 Tax=Rhizobium hidalgonense TaxID=1538159 RepID=A0AAJ2H039_9HYPH|nr:septal ring lytic transglycosylase RlpA family protein [Rhizobium hidalgonense]MDR9778940.1 septal ring lytic transglycosylase RlpA family protein [Rhizobium hidalgonense]
MVKVNDRGPFHGNRVLDLSYGAANKLGITNSGTGNVSIERIEAP